MGKRLITALITIYLLISCQKREVRIDEKSINNLSNSDFRLPSKNGFKHLFFSIGYNQKGQSNVNVLHHIYLKHYSKAYKTYYSFLKEVLNQKLILHKKDFGSDNSIFFEINQSIEDNYNKFALSEFEKYYLISSVLGEYKIKQQYFNEKFTFSILYFLFINNFEITSDDYSGNYQIKRLN